MRMIAGGLAALALAGAVPAVAQAPAAPEPPVLAEPITAPAVVRIAPRDAADPRASAAAPVYWRSVRVPRGILAGVPTGASPTPPRLYPSPVPIPFGFAADPYYSPPAVAVVPPPILFAPFFAPPYLAPPFPYGFDPIAAPIAWPLDGGCFVQSDFAGQHGYIGSCAEALYQQWMSRPY
jgi:hypothetical protein